MTTTELQAFNLRQIHTYRKPMYFQEHLHNLFDGSIDKTLYLSNKPLIIWQLSCLHLSNINLRMETGNVSKRQQPDQRIKNSLKPPMGL